MLGYIRYFFLLVLAYIKRFKAIIFISVLLGIGIFLFGIFILPRYASKNTERIGISGRYYSDTLPDSILMLLSEGLTRLDETGFVKPAIAESWETQDNGKTWVFKIKEDIFWQDGTPITSDTLIYDFTDVRVERPDPYTIVFNLEQPFSAFPSVLTQPVFKKGLLGMKDWKVKNISIAGSYIERLELVHTSGATRIYRFYPTLERTKLAFKLGEVDELVELFEPAPFDTWKTVDIQKHANENQVVTVFFNTQDTTLAEKSVRQALSYAINKNVFDKRALSSIPEYSWAYNPQVKPYDFDQRRAKELIEALPKEAKENLSIKLSTNPFLLQLAEKIANDWRAIGVHTSVQVSTTTAGEFQAFLTIYEMPKDPDQYSIWHSTQTATNISKYSSPRIDKLLEDGRVLTNIDERRKVYLDFQRFLLEDVPALFLYHPQYYTVTRKQ